MGVFNNVNGIDMSSLFNYWNKKGDSDESKEKEKESIKSKITELKGNISTYEYDITQYTQKKEKYEAVRDKIDYSYNHLGKVLDYYNETKDLCKEAYNSECNDTNSTTNLKYYRNRYLGKGNFSSLKISSYSFNEKIKSIRDKLMSVRCDVATQINNNNSIILDYKSKLAGAQSDLKVQEAKLAAL